MDGRGVALLLIALLACAGQGRRPAAALAPAPVAAPVVAPAGGAWIVDEPCVGANVGDQIVVLDHTTASFRLFDLA